MLGHRWEGGWLEEAGTGVSFLLRLGVPMDHREVGIAEKGIGLGELR